MASVSWGSRGRVARVRLGGLVIAALVGVTATQIAPGTAQAKPADRKADLAAVQQVKSVPGANLSRKPAAPKALVNSVVAHSKPPVGVKSEVTVPAAGAAAAEVGAAVRIRGLGRAQGPAVAVEVRSATSAQSRTPAGSPVVVTVSRGKDARGADAASRFAVDVDYAGFANAYGADWGSRARLVEIPACALTTPERAECATSRPVKSHNDAAKRVVSAELAVPAQGAQSVLAMVAGPTGSTGSYAATSLAPAAQWSAGGSSGAFSWSTPLTMPPSTGGPVPQVSVGYSSAGVDGRQVSTNNQTSWLGEGWDYHPGYIERQYKACSDDQAGGNNTVKTGDLCWFSNNVSLSLNGRSFQVVRNDANGAWRLSPNDGSRVEMVALGAGVNGDDNGESWKITTPDGTQYYFGRQRLPGWVSGKAQTDSVFTVPVFGNQPGEPCNATTFDASWCQQAWRWNLDHVVDAHGNTMSYWWVKESNNYGRNLKTAATPYVRGGYLDRIEYGGRAGSELTTTAPVRARFVVSERCLPDASFTCSDAQFTTANATRWPDTPVDQNCATGTACTDRFTPTFWSRKRLTSVTTETVTSAGTYTPVDRWNFVQSFPNSGDGQSPALWLASIERIGQAGTPAVTLPKVTFDGVQLANRVDTTNGAIPAMYRYRVRGVYSESGSVVNVNYSAPECTPTNLPTDDSTNTKRCYPVWWTAPDTTSPIKEYFQKYVTTNLLEQDLTAGTSTKTTNYEYLGGAGWAYDTGETTKAEHRTWNQSRGYSKVRTRVGVAPDPISLTETTYFRGLNGDKLPTGVRSVAAVDSDGVSVPDEPEYAGIARETSIFDRDGGTVQSSSINTPWRGAVLATRSRAGTTALTARTVQTASVASKSLMADGSWRRSRVTKTFNDDGTAQTVSDEGDLAKTGDETCSRMTYPAAGAAWITMLPSQVQTVSKPCSTTPSLPADLVSDSRTYYDNGTLTQAPTRGLVTKVEQLDTWPVGGSAAYSTQSTATYDAYGRRLTLTDAVGGQTKWAYAQTPATTGLITSITETNAAGHASVSTRDPRRGLETASVDANLKRTDANYDAMGRLLQVWFPGRAKATQTANLEYAYTVSATSPSWVSAKVLRDNDSYATTYVIYDGLMRERQTQAPGAVSGRLVKDTFYDSHGLVSKVNNDYFNSASVPSSTVLVTTDNVVPSQVVTQYDGRERAIAGILRGYGVEKWRTTWSYPGGATNTDPPAGQPATAELTDVQGRVVERRRYPSGAITGAYDTTTYDYDSKGRLQKVTDPGGAAWTYEYDLLGRMTKSTDPDTGATSLTYDAKGRTTTSTNSLNQTVWTGYDALDRVTQTRDGSATGALRTSFAYDTLAKGQPTSSSRWVGTSEYKITARGYDDGYRATGSTYSIPTTEGALQGSYAYVKIFTPNGNLLRESMPAAGGLASEVLNYTYTAEQDLSKVTGTTSYLDAVDYNQYGAPVRQYLGSATQTIYASYTYDETTQRIATSTLDRDVAPTRLDARTYSYDDSGNITGLKSVTASGTDQQCYQYDGLARLRQAWTSNADCVADPSVGTGGTVGGANAYWHSYTYDARGNRQTEAIHGTTTGAADTNRTYTYPTSQTVQPHTVRGVTQTTGTTTATETYGFDGAGRMTSRTKGGVGTTLAWDVEGHLASSTTAGKTTSYLYDASGSRLVKRAPGAVTLYMGNTELTLNTTTNVVSGNRIVDLGGAAAVRDVTGNVSIVVGDHQGTGQWSLNLSTQAAVQRKLAPFGADRSGTTSAWPANRGFVGGVNDAETGLVHLGAREYDPALGSFISADPLLDFSDPEQMNGYSYGEQSPVTKSDPSGLAALGPTDDSIMVPKTTGGVVNYNNPDHIVYGSNHSSGPGTTKDKPGKSSTGNGSGKAKSSVSDRDVKKAIEIKKQTVLQVILKAGAQILLEFLGVNDIISCVTKGSISGCVNAIIGMIPWGKIMKAGSIAGAAWAAGKAVLKYLDDARWAAGVLARHTSEIAEGASEVANVGIYVVRTTKGVYVGQSGNISRRLAQHVANDKFTQAEVDAAERIMIRGGKTKREIAEQLKLDSFGGRDADGVLNEVNPIGDRRLDLMPEGYARP